MSDFTSLRTNFKGDLVTPGDEEYPRAIARWASNAERQAKVIAFVKDAQDTGLAIKYAKENKLPIAIRGGGHSASGASSSENGLVVDLSKYLNGVKVDPENKLAVVGGGAIWETVDKATIEHGLATVAGTVNHTGVGGLTLGGGFGWLTSAHGLTIDNLQQATVVVADGSVLTASNSENPDLFFGIRGGGCNFGVVVEFVFRLHPQRRTVYAGFLIYAPSELDKVVDLTQKWLNKEGPKEKETMFQMLARGPDGKPGIMVGLFYNGPEAEGRANFKAFHDLQPFADMTREIPYEQLNALQNPFTGHGRPTYLKGVFQTKPRVESMRKAFERALQLSEGRQMQINLAFELYPLDKVLSVPEGVTAFRRTPYHNVLNIIRWNEDTPENFQYARDAAHELTGIIMKENGDFSEADGIGYGNYDPEANLPSFDQDGSAFSAKAAGVFGSNYPRLQELKKKYDPDSLFNKWFFISPAT